MRNTSEAEMALFEGLRKYPVIVNKNFTLFHAGGRGENYFDIDTFTCKPSMQSALIEVFNARINNLREKGLQFDKIAFIDKDSGPTGVIVLASSIAQEFEKEIVILRPWKRLRFAHIKVKGWVQSNNEYPIKPNDKILLIDDVITTGNTQEKAIALVKAFGAEVTGMVCAFVRDEALLTRFRENQKIEHIDCIYTYEELLILGHIYPSTQDLLSRDFMKELVNNVAPDLLDGCEILKAKAACDKLDVNLDKIISKVLEENEIKADDNVRQGLKNLYFSSLSRIAQSYSTFE